MQETQQGKINAALAGIMADAKAIGKDSKNAQQGFSFRGIDAVMNHLHPIFAKHKVIVLPEVIDERTEERQTRSGGNLIYRMLKIRFTFTAEDGSSVSSVVMGEGMDSGDKAANKAMAVALKYALTQMLLLPYDEVDPDATTPEPSSRKPKDDKPVTPPKKGKATGKVTKLAEKTTEKGKVKYGVELDGKQWYGTFSKTLASNAEALAGAVVEVGYTEDQYGRHLESIDPVMDGEKTMADAADGQRKGQKE